MSEHDELADRLEHEADRLEDASDTVQENIEGTRGDLSRKQGDQGVPGADHDDHFLAPGGGRETDKQALEGDLEDPDAGSGDEASSENR